jgi:hypothetical protein
MSWTKNSAIANYLIALPEPRRERGEAIHRLAKKLFPQASYDFIYRMPTYHVGDNLSRTPSVPPYRSISSR